MTQTVVWFDIPVLDIKRAVQFYEKVLDKKLELHHMEGMDYATFEHSETVGGCLFVRKGAAPVADGVLLYFNADGRLNAAVEEVLRHGGKVEIPAHPIGPFGFRAVVHDSEGNRIALHSEKA